MKKVLAFILMDLATIKPYYKSALFVLGIGIIMGLLVKSVLMPLFMTLICLILVCSYPFIIAEKNGMEVLYSVLPVRRDDVIVGRYLFALAALTAGMLTAFLAALLINAVYSLGVPAGEIAAGLLASSAAGMVVISLQYPLYFRLGYSKAKFAAMIPLLLLSVGIAVAGAVFPGAASAVAEGLKNPALYALLPLVGLALLGVSVFLSRKFYAARDL